MPRTIKVALIGAEDVGKSAIANQFLAKTFSAAKQHTLLFEFGHRRIAFRETVLDDETPDEQLFQVWDCAAGSTAQQFFRGYLALCDAVLVVYDSTRVDTFRSVGEFLNIAKEENPRAVRILVGNKDDERDKAQVSTTEAYALARDNSVFFTPCAASRYLSVEAVFRLVADQVPDRPEELTRASVPEPLTLEEVVKGATNTKQCRGECCTVV